MISKIDLNRDKDGLISMKDNPELLELQMAYMKEHDPELFKEMNEKMNELVEGQTYEEGYEIGEHLYKKSSIELKQRFRSNRIKFVKWFNNQIKNNEDKLTYYPNKFGEKLYD